MRKHIVLLAITALLCANGFGQGLVTLSTERNSDNSLSILAATSIFGEYTVRLQFSEFSGYNSSLPVSSNIAIATVFRSSRIELSRLTQQKVSGRYALEYKYSYYPGRALRRVSEPDYLYLLPAKEGRAVQSVKVSSLEELLKRPDGEKIYPAGFIFKQGDTICASRAGVVSQLEDANSGDRKTELYSNSRNNISIQHKDGTIGHYSILAPVEALVTPGDYVVPGQPIAVFNKPADKYYVFFSVSYLDEKKLAVNYGNISRSPVMYTHLPLHFSDAAGKAFELESNKEYTAAHPKELVGAELSRKDKKRLGL